MLRSGSILSRSVWVAAVVMTAAACATGFSKDEAVEAFQAANPEASTLEAVCVVEALMADYEDQPADPSDLRGLEAELLAEPPKQQFVLDQYRAMFGCGMTADVEAQLRRELVANGVDADAVGCVAAELADNLTDSELDVLIDDEMNDSFYATFFDAVETCDALPN